MTVERLTDAEFLARLDRETTVSLRDRPERWRWVRAGGVKTSASADSVDSAQPEPVGVDLPPPPVSPRGNGPATRVRSESPPEPHLTHDGLTLTSREWAARTGLRRQAITLRLRNGWTVEETLTTPAGAARPRSPSATTAVQPEADDGDPEDEHTKDLARRVRAALASGPRTLDELVTELGLPVHLTYLVKGTLIRLRWRDEVHAVRSKAGWSWGLGAG